MYNTGVLPFVHVQYVCVHVCVGHNPVTALLVVFVEIVY